MVCFANSVRGVQNRYWVNTICFDMKVLKLQNLKKFSLNFPKNIFLILKSPFKIKLQKFLISISKKIPILFYIYFLF